MKEIYRSNKLILLFLLLVAIYHFATLSFSPIPWFDETFFASISRSVREGKGLILQAAPLYTGDKPVLIYGPIYFYLQAGIMWLLGFSVWSFRILNLLAAAGVLIIVNQMLKDKIRRTIRVSIVLLLAFDTIFVQNAHSGRMDLLSLLFLLIAYFPILKNKTTFTGVLGSAFLLLTAILTTPRIIVFSLPLTLWLLYLLIKEKKIIPLLIFCIVLPLGYYLWIAIGFGNIKSFFSYYSDPSVRKGSKTLIDGFVGGNFNIWPYQIPLILITLITLFIRLKKWTWLTIICTTNILSFYLIVKDTGIYSSLVISFWLMLLAENISIIKAYSFKTQMTLITVIGIINLGIFLIKSIIIFASWEQRSPSSISNWINANIPKGSKVVGDYKYYYATTENGSDFQFIGLGGTPEERLAYHLNTYKVDFILTSSDTDHRTLQTYTNGIGKYKKVRINPVPAPGTVHNIIGKILKKLSIRFSEGEYEGIMYEVTR